MKRSILKIMLCIMCAISLLPSGMCFGINADAADYSEWTFEKAEENNGTITIEGGTYSDNTMTDWGGNATSGTYDVENGLMVIRFDGSLSQGEQSFSVASSVRTVTEILSFDGSSINAFGQDDVCILNPDTEYDFTIAIDFSAEVPKGSVWVDNKFEYSGEYSRLSRIDPKNAYLYIENNGKSILTLSNFDINKYTPEVNFSTTPASEAYYRADENGKIVLDYGTFVDESNADADNFMVVCNGETVDITVNYCDTYIELIPDGGFLENAQYAISGEKGTDIFGNDLGSFDLKFGILSNDYNLPEISFKTDLTDAQTYANKIFAFEIEANKELERIDVYINEEYDISLDRKPWVYNFKEESVGTYNVKLIAYDDFGLFDEISATIEVKESTPPELIISGIEDGAVYLTGKLPEIAIQAVAADGVKKIELYDNGALSAAADGDSAVFPLAGLYGGEHILEIRAESNNGAVSSKTYNIEIKSDLTNLLYNVDFSQYTGGASLPSNLWGAEQRGYLASEKIKENYGNSLIIGMKTVNEAYQPDNSAYVGFYLQDLTGAALTEFDIYIDEKPGQRLDGKGNDKFAITLKKNGSTETTVTEINADGMKIGNSLIDYSTKTWYHFSYDVDIPARKTTVTVTGDDIDRTFVIDINTAQDTAHYLRIYGPVFDNVETFVAVDNFELKQHINLPVIEFEKEIKDGDATVTFNTSESLLKRDLSTDNIVLTPVNGGTCEIESISANGNEITLHLKNSVKGSQKYTLTILPQVRYESGQEIGISIVGSFTVTGGSVSIETLSYSDGIINIGLVNNSGIEKNVYAIMQSWYGNEIKRVKIVPITIISATGTQNLNISAPAVQNGEVLTLYVWSELNNPTAVIPGMYSFTK